MSEFSLAVVEKETQFSTLLLSNFVLFCSFILSHPLYFSYFIFFSPYLFKIFSFLSPLFVTTSLLILAFFKILTSEVVDDDGNDDGFGCLEELEVYKIVFHETSTIVENRETPDEVLDMEADQVIVDCVQDGSSVHKPETLTTSTWPETVQVNAVVNIFEDFLREKDGVVENMSSEKVEKESVESNKSEGSKAMGNKISDPEPTVNADYSEELEAKTMVNSQRVKANYGDGYNNYDTMGSMRKEKEWKRTLACKLFEERHNTVAGEGGGGAEGMDLLWETYESTDSNKAKLRNFGSKKGKKGGNNGARDDDDDDDDDDYEEDSDGPLCCLQALKFSTGKMNLGMGMGRPNFVKITKAIKGFGWLHHVGSTKHSKKGYY